MVARTLGAMARGGIHDHVGGGFHRYSVDGEWFVPHFEKMLYDQAQIACALEAWQATGERAARPGSRAHVLDYVLRDMTGPEGGFYSAEDADSPEREGCGARRGRLLRLDAGGDGAGARRRRRVRGRATSG